MAPRSPKVDAELEAEGPKDLGEGVRHKGAVHQAIRKELSMSDLIDELQKKSNQLDVALRSFHKNRIALAEAERKYKEEVSKKALELRDQGMAVTLIDKVIYGLPTISTLRFQRDCAEAVYEANQEAINVFKLQMRLIEAQISREWGNPQ